MLQESYTGRFKDANTLTKHKQFSLKSAEKRVLNFNFCLLNRNGYLCPLKFVQRDIKPGAVRPGLYRKNPSQPHLRPHLVSLAHD